jgi:hypothetical protein
VRRTFSHRSIVATAFFFAVLCMLGSLTRTSAQDQTATPVVVGRLATVEPARGRVTVVPEGEVNLVEMFVDENGRVEREGQTLTLADLVIEVGRRVTVRYRLSDGRRIVELMAVEPELVR